MKGSGAMGLNDGKRLTYWCGGSQFDTSGNRLNEIDLDVPSPRSMADMTEQDWTEAEAALSAFDAEHRPSW
ncbi:hypothetical protein SAMN05421837_104600 [Amycolatopsis pretoriensis]|uniref:Uncharacterized protein n=1 Tax=Amycolatopsis pretoriensis TaxID=218821 RepID=A0A1H5QSZ0_9PSEU|nr:hypothetical protein SAMN05421837_104600 [Amycolatopsis pretoriensis]